MLISLIRDGRVRAVCVYGVNSRQRFVDWREKCLCIAVEAAWLCLFVCFFNSGSENGLGMADIIWHTFVQAGSSPFNLSITL